MLKELYVQLLPEAGLAFVSGDAGRNQMHSLFKTSTALWNGTPWTSPVWMLLTSTDLYHVAAAGLEVEPPCFAPFLRLSLELTLVGSIVSHMQSFDFTVL